MKRTWLMVLLVAASIAIAYWQSSGHFGTGIGVSGQSFTVGDHFVVIEFGYSKDGDTLRYAVIRTWPKEVPPQERLNDPRIAWDRNVKRLVRDNDGRMAPVGTDGDVYFFTGDQLKTMRVKMNEHDDTIGLNTAKTLDEIWAHFQRFRVE